MSEEVKDEEGAVEEAAEETTNQFGRGRGSPRFMSQSDEAGLPPDQFN